MALKKAAKAFREKYSDVLGKRLDTAQYIKHPRRLLNIVWGRSRKVAIEAMCLSCLGEHQLTKVAECACDSCPLWCVRPGAKPGDRPSWVPDKQDVLDALEGE